MIKSLSQLTENAKHAILDFVTNLQIIGQKILASCLMEWDTMLMAKFAIKRYISDALVLDPISYNRILVTI